MKPWEKYASATPVTPEASAKPWEKYSQPEVIEPSPQPQPEPEKGFFDKFGDYAIDNTIGAVRGAADIGNSIINAATFLPRKVAEASADFYGVENPFAGVNEAREASLEQWTEENQDRPGFTVGRIGANIAGTAGVGNVLAIGANALNKFKLAQSLKTGGFSLGGAPAATKVETVTNAATRVGGAGATGAAAGGLIDPDSALEAGAVSAAIPVVGKVGGTIGQAIKGTPIDDLALTAIDKYNIPLDKASVGGKIAKATKSVLDDVLIGGVGSKQKELIRSAYNREIGKTFGAEADKLTPEVMANAKAKIGSAYDKIWNQNEFVMDRDFADKATDIVQEASMKLNPEQTAQIARQFDNLIAQAKDGKISGGFVNNWQSELRQIAESEKGLHKKLINDLRQVTLKAFKNNISKADADLLNRTNIENRAFKTVEPLLAKAEAGVAARDIGDVPAGLLPMAVYQQYGNRVAQSPFADLAPIGSKYIADRVAKTGGSERALIQNVLTFGGASAGFAAAGTPALLGVPAAYTLQKLLSLPKNTSQGKNTIGKLLSESNKKGISKAAPALTARDDR